MLPRPIGVSSLYVPATTTPECHPRPISSADPIAMTMLRTRPAERRPRFHTQTTRVRTTAYAIGNAAPANAGTSAKKPAFGLLRPGRTLCVVGGIHDAAHAQRRMRFRVRQTHAAQ